MIISSFSRFVKCAAERIPMNCIKCKKEIQADMLYCPYCGKKQTATKAKYHKRESGTGTIVKDTRYKKQWLAYAPMYGHQLTRKYIGCYSTRAEAAAAIEEFIKNGRPDYYNATFQQVYDLWSAQHYKAITASGAGQYRSMWKWYEPLYTVKMADLRAADYQGIVDKAKSAAAANKLIALASMINTYAMENDIIQKDYSAFVKPPKFEKKEKKIFSREDIAALWAHSDDLNVQTVLIMIYTGFRVGEIMGLKKSDIHFDKGYMIGGEKTESGKNRIIPFPPQIPELKEFMQNQMTRYDSEILFPIDQSTFRKTIFNPALQAAELTGNYTPHSTRHTFATLSAAAGIKPENLQKIIGHANFSTTAEVYIHQDLTILQEEMNKITK